MPVAKTWEDIAYRYAVGTHGFPLPDIKTWNDWVTAIRKEIKNDWNFKGAVDDLVNGQCKVCDSDLIRASVLYGPLFQGGIVYCPDADGSASHPMDYWTEIWPDASWKPNERMIDRIGMDLGQVIENKWKLSDHRINKCFHPVAFQFHQIMESHIMEDDPEYKPKKFPKPTYTHI